MKLNFLSLFELRDRLRSGKISPADILTDIRERYDAVEPKVLAYARPPHFVAPKPAAETGALAGVPIALKDNICTEGELTECASRILEGFVSPYDATVAVKLKESGAVVIGKTNMDEFAFGSSCETSCFHATHNPWNLDCVPGGSSGGSAASVAADEVIAALGSDTGGSIRQPAAFCGIVGLKPTYGRVSRYGLIAFASSLDQIGPMTKNVKDNALLLKIISGHDEMDATSARVPVPDFVKACDRDVKGMRVAIPKEYFVEGIDPQVRAALDEAKKTLSSLGVVFGEASLPHTEYAIAVYYIVATAEASSNLARFDGVQYGLRVSGENAKGETGNSGLLGMMYKKTRGAGFGAEAKRRIILGTYVLSRGYYDAYYLRALKVRTLIKKDFEKLFDEFDLVLTPTAPTAAFRIGEKLDNPLSMYLSDIYTISANLAGLPALSLPCGMTKIGLPIGMQVIGKPFGEEDIYRIAYNYEQKTPWHQMKPNL